MTDTSKEYIKMCDCEEIQKQYKETQFWDIFYDKIDERIKENHKYKGGYIWLPSQGQLQEIFGWTQIQYHNDFSEFDDYFENGEIPISWEKLWLRMVMKEKYNKTWNIDKWQ